MKHLLVIGLLCLFVSCTTSLEKQQGNVIDADKVTKIRQGLSQIQVINLIGQPLLIHPLKNNVWIYAYQKKTAGSTKVISKHLKLTFNEQGVIAEIQAHNIGK